LLPQCRHARIDLQWQPTDHPINVLGDAGRLGHLVFNVIGNAVEAAGPGGSVQVQLRVSTDNRIHLEVTDSGPGPPERIAARLFEPFVTGKPEGIGLGLAVAHEVAVQHGGRIAWNRVDGRTCFAIELPALRPVQPEDENASEAAVAHR
jgi:signal transduction histidine kinase